MNDNELKSPAEIKRFLAGSQPVKLSDTKHQRYVWIGRVLKRTQYFELTKKDKGIVREYMKKATNYSDSQLSNLIQQYQTKKWIGVQHRSRTRFRRCYTNNDILLLIETDKQHDNLSGPVTKKLFERAYSVYNDKACERLSKISTSHIYNLRKSKLYLRHRNKLEKTKQKAISIGERRKPKTNGKPGYIGIDTVHQGDMDNEKGVYHINAVDEVTQFEVVSSVE